MAVQYSIQRMVSDGTLSTVVLGIPYLQRNDIYIRIAGVETPQSGAPSGYTWSFVDNSTLRILPVVPVEVEVTVYRRTDFDSMYNVYSQNAQFDESTIDENNQQLLYIAQEYFEQGIPGASIEALEYVRATDDGYYYRFKLTDGSYTPEFLVPSSPDTKLANRAMWTRFAAESGYVLAAGDFETGGVLLNSTQVLLDESTQGIYSWSGAYPVGGYVVAPGIDPTAVGSGYVPRTDVVLRDQLLDGPLTQMLSGRFALRDMVSVLDFDGVIGNGIHDDTVGFKAASDYLVSIGGGILLVPKPSVKYMVGDLVMRCSMVGIGKPTIQNTNTANLTKGIRYTGVTPHIGDLLVQGITFDGGVSADPADWASGYDSFTGNFGLYIAYSPSRVTVRDCNFSNAHWSGLRIEECNGVLIENCHTRRTRGNFGDGYYCVGSRNVKCVNSSAYDFTRIGFVSDLGCSDITVDNFDAEYGHHQSTNYGGSEYNRPVWLENTQNGKILNSNSKNTEGGSFTIAFGIETPVAGNRATGLISNCTSYNSGILGVVTSPFGVAGDIRVEQTRVYGCHTPFQTSGEVAAGVSTIVYDKCHGEASGADASSVFGFNTGASGHVAVIVKDCTGKLLDHSLVDSTSNNVADFGGYTGMIGSLTIDNYQNVNNYGVIKLTQISNMYLEVNIKNSKFHWFYCPVVMRSNVNIENASFSKFRASYQIAANEAWPDLTMNNVTFIGLAQIGSLRVRGNCKVVGNAAQIVCDFNTPNTSILPLIDAQIDIEKSVPVGGAGLIVNQAPGVITRNIVRGTWKNTEGVTVPTATGSFFQATNTNAFFYGYGLLKDASVVDYCSTAGSLAAISVPGGQSVTLN
ncbi:hypothetical protein [Aeromonas phage PS]|uniref:Uncharacterized protein n=1 Tax=Aeromonas phage PS TaxID=2723762 RepID=A0A6H0X6N1_9CAUD|nr:hypothetical protein [Aeromonas phage PS]